MILPGHRPEAVYGRRAFMGPITPWRHGLFGCCDSGTGPCMESAMPCPVGERGLCCVAGELHRALPPDNTLEYCLFYTSTLDVSTGIYVSCQDVEDGQRYGWCPCPCGGHTDLRVEVGRQWRK